MDLNENTIKEEVSSFMSSLQRLLPKKKDIIILAPPEAKLTRLCDIHAETKNVFPKCFLGAKLIILREIMDKVKLVQQYNYGKSKETYRCFSQLLHKEMEPKSSEDGLLIDSGGCATATYTEHLDAGYIMRITSRIKDLISSETELVFEKDSAKSLGSLTCVVKDVDPNTTRVVTQWMYRIRPDFSIGTEVGIKPFVSPYVPDYSLSARYVRPSFVASSTVSKTGFQVCFHKQFAKDLRIAAVIHDGNRGGQTSVGIAIQKNFRNGSELKVFVDSMQCGGFTYQKDILFFEPQSEVRVLRLIGSTLIDKQRRVRFGMGVHLDF